MEIIDFLGILIVGVIASGVIELINKHLGLASSGAKLATVGVSIILGGIYFLCRDTAWWTTMVGILTTASTVYAFFLKTPKPE